jgi:hypothetical protein
VRREKEEAALVHTHDRQQLDELVNGRYRSCLYLNEDSVPLIRKHIDYFVNLCRSNDTLTAVYFRVRSLVGQDDELWDKSQSWSSYWKFAGA